MSRALHYVEFLSSAGEMTFDADDVVGLFMSASCFQMCTRLPQSPALQPIVTIAAQHNHHLSMTNILAY